MFLQKVVPPCLHPFRCLFSGSTSSSSGRKKINNAVRIRLAAAYRGLDFYGLNEGIANHLSAIAPSSNSDKETMLILPSHLRSSQATPSNLIEVDEKNEVVAGVGEPDKNSSSIHREIYRKRPDVKAVIHTHMRYATALTCLKDPKLLMLHQNSTRFHNRIVFDSSYEGVGDSSKANLLVGDCVGRKNVLLVRNHGVLVVAESIDVAFDDVYYLEKAAMIQVLALSTHQELKVIEEDIADKACKEILKAAPDSARRHLDSFVRRFSSWGELFLKFPMEI